MSATDMTSAASWSSTHMEGTTNSPIRTISTGALLNDMTDISTEVSWTGSWSTFFTSVSASGLSDNETIKESNPVYEALGTFNSILLPVLMVIIMTSIGCMVTYEGLKEALRRPVGIAIGFGGQFIVLPLMAFAMAVALKMEAPHALGMMMVATSPGGVSSSLFVYWMNGNICLSLCMSTVATVASVGMMPLNLFIYSRYWEAANITIPYVEIVTSLAVILIPVAIGFFIRYKKESWTKYIIKTGSILGLIAIIVNIAINAVINGEIFTCPWSVWFNAVCLPFFSFIVAYLLAWALRQDHTNCRTIAVETTSQNVSLTLAIIGITFTGQELDALVVYPTLFSVFLIIDGLIMVPMYWIGVWYVLPKLGWVPKTEDVKVDQEEEDERPFKRIQSLEAAEALSPTDNGNIGPGADPFIKGVQPVPATEATSPV